MDPVYEGVSASHGDQTCSVCAVQDSGGVIQALGNDQHEIGNARILLLFTFRLSPMLIRCELQDHVLVVVFCSCM